MITNEWIRGTDDLSVPMEIRREVFVAEQRVPKEIEEDADDRLSLHAVIYDGERPVATGRIWHDGKTFRIGRCAVRADVRGQGIGDLLVKLLLLKVFEYHPSAVEIHAQTHAQDFYARYGFRLIGERFMEAGIEHVPMRVTKETLVFPSPCGDKHYSDFFDEDAGAQQAGDI